MVDQNLHITFDKLDEKTPIPYELLLLADPSKHLVNQYIKCSNIYIAKKNDELIGVIVLFQLTASEVEIKNIAVKPTFQQQGIGSLLIGHAIQIALLNRQKTICIGTANSSVGQLYLYQKFGFDITNIISHFFIDNYAEPIYENGIQAKHKIVLKKLLNHQ